MAEKRALGQNLDIQKRRRRLKRNRGQLVEPVQPARRVHVKKW
jgi:hypothetical protein